MGKAHDNAVVNDSALHVTSVLGNDRAVVRDDATVDEQLLGALGYKQEFKRDLSIWHSFSVSFAVLGVVPSIAATLTYSFGYAGTGGAVWGWIAASIMIQATAFSMAELCSSLPTAGGLYYASAVLAPQGWGPMASWFVGWSNFCGFVTGPCSLNYALAAMITTAAEISYPDYVAKDWHIYLILLLLFVMQGLLSMQSTRFIGILNLVGTIINLIVLVVLIIWFPVGSVSRPKTNDSLTVWTSFTNGTDWPTGWATIMGFLTTIYTMCGYDAPFHLAEECSNANIASPRAIVMTAQLGAYLGFAVILVIAYTIRDVSDVVLSSFGQPFASLCIQVLGKEAGLAMLSLNALAQFFCGLGCLVTTTRVVFAYSRDGAIVGSRWWSRVDPRTKTPVLATWGVLFIAALLALLIFAGPIAIGAVFSIGAIGQYTAFTIPIALKLFFSRGKFVPGPWNLGVFSKPINAIACAWYLLIVPALCFPAVTGANLNATTMNWTCLIYGGVMLFAMSWYAVSGRKWFKGPKINIEHIHGIDSINGPLTSSELQHEAKLW